MITTNTQPTVTSKRPPVVCVMGHIDHGKSTLLDFIRKSNVVDKEIGGITQKLSAYEVVHSGSKITFLDTPGHEAFAAIRARGASVADIAILVVSAEDGVKPQTLDALRAITAAKLPYIVAINKIDKESANIENTKQTLAEHEVYVEGYGGDIPWNAISAKTGAGVSELLDTILLLADIQDLRADTKKAATGVVIEAHIDTKKGITATMIIKDGHTASGMCFVAGKSFSPGRIVENFLAKKIAHAEVSSPIRVVGFDSLPLVGSTFQAFSSKKEAEAYMEKSIGEKKILKINSASSTVASEDSRVLIPLIVKADVSGSLDAVLYEISKITHDKILLKVVHSGIGTINENDVKQGGGNQDALIIGFAVSAEPRAKEWADRSKTPIHTFDIIYKLAEWLAEEVQTRIPKVATDEASGRAKIIRVFSNTKDKYIIGGKVESGSIHVGDEVKVIRREEVLGKAKIRGLQQKKETTQEVKEGFEFGAQVQSPMELAPGDRLEAFVTVSK